MNFRLFLVVVTGLLLSHCTGPDQSLDMGETLFNDKWEFVIAPEQFNPRNFMPDQVNELGWEPVTLPHTPVIEPLVMTGQQWQGTCIYRKVFDNPNPSENRHIAIRFGAAMHRAEVYLNGELLKTHSGGYLPFIVDLTGRLQGRDNIILVVLNNENDPSIPPGKPIERLDFNYYGGLYRDVLLLDKDLVHITDPVEAGREGGGGILIAQENINHGMASFTVSTEVANISTVEEDVSLVYRISDPSGVTVETRETVTVKLEAGSTKVYNDQFMIENPSLWSPDYPSLYLIEIEVRKSGRTVDRKYLRTGLRELHFDEEGFFINGQRLKIRGTNRHQEYPYIGYAIGNNADYRDAYKIKEAGFNFVRCSHYPHSEEFLDSCDELGILVMDAIPGWQFFGDTLFQDNSKQDLRDMIRRDRNHPSIILWEASLNESWMPVSFIEEMQRITKRELPGILSYTCGWIDTVYDVFIPARQHAKPPDYWNKFSKSKPLLIAEYGDWEYYAQNAGFNQTEFGNLMPEERSSRQLRGFGQVRLAQQALNYQEAHNDNLKGSHAGDANWLMFDYNRGYAPDIESSGVMDIFRLPKFAYWFYRSQKPLYTNDTVLYIANWWSDPGFTDIKVYSNCEEVELWLNDSLIARKGPDSDRYSTHLDNPPFTFNDINYAPGKLEARGFIDDRMVVSDLRLTPGQPDNIWIDVDLSGREIESGGDVVFIYASVLDENGTVVPDAVNEIEFFLSGEGDIIGGNPVKLEAGIASIIYRSGQKPGTARIEAGSANLEGSITILEIK